VNLYFKNGSPTNNLLSRLKSLIIGKRVFESALSLISPQGYTITRENLIMHPGYTTPGNLQTKHGNLGPKMTLLKSFLLDFSLWKLLILTYHISKQLLDCSSQYGGKIAEKANAIGNSMDTQKISKTLKPLGLLLYNNRLQNSVSLIKVSITPSHRNYSTQDLSNESRTEPSITDFNSYDPVKGQEIVISKQMELVRLAEKLGLHDKKVFDLQLVLARSFAFRAHAIWLLLSKPGSATPGLDNEIINTENKAEMFKTLIEYLRDMIYHPKNYQPTDVKRVWIPKPGKPDKRPLGIPTIRDRALQSLVNLVLYPLVELTSDPNSYGFRTHRDSKLAIAAVRAKLRSTNLQTTSKALKTRFSNPKAGALLQANENKWILDADIKGFFDNISLNWLCKNLFLHPTLTAMVKKWLKARILDGGTYSDPINGTPQGGIISPTLANFTLNGLEETALKSIYPITTSVEQRKFIRLKDGQITRLNVCVSLIRYADDFVVIARSKYILNKYVTPAISIFLKERGL
jgi:retron-type reverse transcriptase